MQSSAVHHLRMLLESDPDPDDVDDAILVAAARARSAQDAVAVELDDERPPPDGLTEVVVERAVDLKDLAREALDDPRIDEDAPERADPG